MSSLKNELVLPLVQRRGVELRPVVQLDDVVSQGQLLAVATPRIDGLVDPVGGYIPAASLHAPANARVMDCREHVVVLGSQLSKVRCLIIEPMKSGTGALPGLVRRVEPASSAETDAAMARIRSSLPATLARLSTPEGALQALQAIRQDSGLVGLGGGGFPLHAKLAGSINRLVVNAAECEPYADADNALMQSAPGTIIAGCFLVCRLLGLDELSIAIKAPLSAARARLEATEADLRSALSETFRLPRLKNVEIPAQYPAGAEQQVIRHAFGIEIPAGQRASQAGIACINISTLAALGRFLLWAEPLTHRLVTVAGAAVTRPGNYQVAVGLPVFALLDAAGVVETAVTGLVHGGGMMGIPVEDTQLPLGKTSYCIIAAGAGDRGLAVAHAVRQRSGRPLDASPCIRCGFCEPVCPVGLLPQQLHFAAIAKDSDWLQAHHLSACIECGACEAVCPSRLPLVAEYRTAKSTEAAEELARLKAEHARVRFEQRTERLRLEALERDARRSARKAALSNKRPAP